MLRWPPAARSTRLPGQRGRPEFRDSVAFAALLSVLLHLALLLGLAVERPAPAVNAPAPATEITLASSADFARATAPPPKAAAEPTPENPPAAKPDAVPLPPQADAAPPGREAEKGGDGWVQSREALSKQELANPRNRKTVAALQTLESETRRQQLCDLEAILQINRQYPKYAVDFVIAYATEAAVRAGATLIAHGAAFHSAGAWRRLAFECQWSANQRDVASLKFKIGDPIPADQWSALNLPKSPAPSLGND
jgi:hypothetical protein